MSIVLIRLSAAAFCLLCCHAFPISSSQSSDEKKILTNQKSKGSIQGFGKQENLNLHTADSSQSTVNLINFLTSQNSQGISGEKKGCEIGFSNEDGMRGVYATKSFRQKDIICKIPSDCALALSTPDLGGADVPTLAHCGRNFLDMYTNHPVGSKTWAAYLNSLPLGVDSPHFSPTPDFFTDDEIEALEFPRSVNQVKQRLLEIAELCAKDDIPFDDLQFSTWLVSSRSLQIAMEGESKGPEGATSSTIKSIRVMLPYLDMINHSSDNANAEMHLIDPEKDEAWFAIRAVRPIKEGKEITISYGGGVETSPMLLHNYGFVPSQNRFDKIMLKKGGDESIENLEGWSTLLDEDEKLLNSSGLSGNMKKILQFRLQLKRSYS